MTRDATRLTASNGFLANTEKGVIVRAFAIGKDRFEASSLICSGGVRRPGSNYCTVNVLSPRFTYHSDNRKCVPRRRLSVYFPDSDWEDVVTVHHCGRGTPTQTVHVLSA